MSRSSLWVMNDKYEGLEVIEFSNSWLFSPMVWGVLLDKYMRNQIQTDYGYKKSLITNHELNNPLNEVVNNCKCTPDRICWEMSNQQVFFTKDKHVIANNIKEFLNINSGFDRTNDGIYPLKQEHIIERFTEIADEIVKLDENESPYFIFKNTSCDDNVECWFSFYDKEKEECSDIPLSEQEKRYTEFVFIEDNKINKFISNLEYFNK